MRVRTPWPECGNHQCCTSPCANCRPAARKRCSRVAFVDMRGRQTDWTGDRREFIGRNGALANPAALRSGAALSNTVGAGLDPCAAMRTRIELPPGGAAEIVVFLGDAGSRDEARATGSVGQLEARDLD